MSVNQNDLLIVIDQDLTALAKALALIERLQPFAPMNEQKTLLDIVIEATQACITSGEILRKAKEAK